MRNNNRVLHLHSARRCKVGDVALHATRVQHDLKSGFVDQRIAREVQQHYAFLHKGAHMGINHTDGVLQRRNMDGDVVARAEDILKVSDVVNGAGDFPCGAYRNERVVTVYVHAQLNCGVGNLGTNSTQTDNTQLLALDFLTGELLLCLFGCLGDVLVIRIFAAPFNTAQNVTATQQKRAKHDFLNGVGICARGVKDHDAFVSTAIERNVVHASARARNSAKTSGEFHIMHGGTANKNALCFIQ